MITTDDDGGLRGLGRAGHRSLAEHDRAPLGDAAHAVPPTGGRGAATAVQDAADLCEALLAAARGQVTPAMAVHDYEQLLRPRGAEAVRESLQPLAWIKRTATPAGAAATAAALPLVATSTALTRHLGRRRW